MSEHSYLYVKTKTQVWGPISHAEFVYLTNSGRIHKSDLVLSSIKPRWIRIDQLYSLASLYPRNGRLHRPKVIVVGGNKGGVGKTMFASSLALALAKQGKSVVAIDTDFSDPDLNEWLGVKRPDKTLGHFFKKRVNRINDLVIDTRYPNLKLIAGEARTLEDSNPRYYQRSSLANQVTHLKEDFVIMDQSPGISYSSVDFFLNADEKILVTIPEPSAILSAFRFIRIALLRKIKSVFRHDPDMIHKISAFEFPIWYHSYTPLSVLYNKIRAYDARAGLLLDAVTNTIRPRLVLNMVMDRHEITEGYLFTHAVSDLLMMSSEFLGIVPYMIDLRDMSKERKPLKIISTPEKFIVIDDDVTAYMNSKSPSPLFGWLSGKRTSLNSRSVVHSLFANMITHWPQ